MSPETFHEPKRLRESPVRLLLGRVDQVRKLDRVLDEEGRVMV